MTYVINKQTHVFLDTECITRRSISRASSPLFQHWPNQIHPGYYEVMTFWKLSAGKIRYVDRIML